MNGAKMYEQPGSLAPASTSRRRLAAVALIAALFMSTTVMIWITARPRVLPFNSDQIIVILTARDIREQGQHPVFYPGAEYGGTVEPHLLAAYFAVFPETQRAYRAFLALFYLVSLVSLWGASRLLYGDRAAVWSAAYLALAPFFLYYKVLTSDGAYASLVAAESLTLLFAALAFRRADEERSVRGPIVIAAFFAGVAWWIHTLAIVFIAPVAVCLLWSRKVRGQLSAGTAIAAAGSFIAGGFPWWWRNVRHDWPSLRMQELSSTNAGDLSRKISEFLEFGITAPFGSRTYFVAVTGGGKESFAGADQIVPLAVLFFCVTTAAVALRTRRPAVVLPLAVLLVTIGASLVTSRTDFREPRYLLPAIPAVALMVGAVVTSGRWRIAAVSAALLLLAANSIGLVRSTAWGGDIDLAPVSKQLCAQNMDNVYASYWDAYRLEMYCPGVNVSPFGADGVVRRRHIAEPVEADATPEFLLAGGDTLAMDRYLAHKGVVAQKITVGTHAIYRGLPAEVVAELRRVRHIPYTPAPRSVRWLSVGVPPRVRAGQTVEVPVRFTVTGPAPWRQGINVGARWIIDGQEIDAGRYMPPEPPRRGRPASGVLTLSVNVGPGRHTLLIDAVEENVAWFNWKGGIPWSGTIEVMP